MAVLVGLDLAWSGRNPSGYCVLRVGRGGEFEVEALGDCVMSAGQAVSWLEGFGPDVVAAIDAPLIVGDARRAESELARGYPRTGLYAYSARWDFLSRHDITAGPELGALLDTHGWTLDPTALPPEPSGRWALEVFPHAVAVSLLGCASILRYKRGLRTHRLDAFREYQSLLLAEARLRLGDSCAAGLADVLESDASLLRGRALKSLEDRLDAIACGLAAHVAFREGAAGLRIFGEATEGYIAVPVTSGPGPPCP